MKPKPFVRYLDFIVVMLSLNFLHVLVLGFIWIIFGSEQEESVVHNLTPIISIVLYWTQMGLTVLFFKRVPFRVDIVDAPVAFRKIWVMAFFWPLLFTK